MRSRKVLVGVVFVTIAVGAALWIGRYHVLYYYYLWRLDHATEQGVIIALDEDIESIAPHIVPLLVRTYEDVNASKKHRVAAGIGLIRADKKRAETLFLENNDNGIYAELYYYYLWRLNHTAIGGLIMDLHDDIRSISPHIVPLLLRTYEDVEASERSRHAAGLALIRADKDRAENLFISFLDNSNDEIVASAILHLSVQGSDKPFKRITGFAHHPNERIRWTVALYLGSVGNTESIALLKEMMKDDPDRHVRSCATFELQELGVLPRPLTPAEARGVRSTH